MENTNKKVHTALSLFFWGNIITLVVALLILLYIKGPDFGTNIESNIVFEQYAVILTLIGIPAALKLFHWQQKKIEPLGYKEYWAKYPTIYGLRIVILDIVVILNFIGFYMFESKNFIYMAIITIFAVMFCYPSKNIFETKKTEIKEDNNIKE